MKDIGDGVCVLAIDEQARTQLWNQLGDTVTQVRSGNPFIIGRLAGEFLPLGAATKTTKLTKATKLAKPTKMGAIHAKPTTGPVKVTSGPLTPKPVDFDVRVAKSRIRRGKIGQEEVKALPKQTRDQLRGVDLGGSRDTFGRYTGKDTISANKETQGLAFVAKELGQEVRTDRVLVKFEKGGQGRFYDGLVHDEGIRYIGIEIKSGSAHARYKQPGSKQRQFDELVSGSNPAKGKLDGESVEIVRVVVHRVE